MATRVETIIKRARWVLGDSGGVRWETDQLLDLIDEGQKQIVIAANLLRSTYTQPIRREVAEYDTPDDCHLPTRFLVFGKKVTLKSHEEMDELAEDGKINVTNDSWEEYEGDPVQYLVFDKLAPGKFKLYPIPTEVFTNPSYLIEAVTTTPSNSTYNTDYGFIVSMTGFGTDLTSGDVAKGMIYTTKTYGAGDDFSNVANIGASANVQGAIWQATASAAPTTWTNGSILGNDLGMVGIVQDSDEGVYYDFLSDIDEDHGILIVYEDNDSTDLKIYYLKIPTEITAVDSTLEIDPIWDMVLMRYVTGMAFRNNRDVQNQELADKELGLFAGGLQDIITKAAQDNVATRTQYQTSYNDGFN